MSFGSQIEELVIAKLGAKCDLKRDPEFDHVYMIDFVIDRFRHIAKLHHIGVQLTTNPIDNGKKTRFVFERRKKALVDRSLYVEIDPGTNLDAYGIELLYVALVQFAFSNDLCGKDIMGLTIGPGVTYRFYDIESEVEMARELKLPFDGQQPDEQTDNATEPQPPEPIAITAATNNSQMNTTRYRGTIRKYTYKGYGFIIAKRHDNGKVDEWFFHRENCDSHLLAEIDSRLTTGNYQGIQVLFNDGGFIKKDAPAAAALNVCLHSVTRKPVAA